MVVIQNAFRPTALNVKDNDVKIQHDVISYKLLQ